MSSRSGSGWLVAIVFLGVLIGIVGGGLLGGVAGYYVARNNQVALPVAAPIQTSAGNTNNAPTSVTNLTLKSDSAVIDAASKVEPAVVTVINTLTNSSSPFGGRGSQEASGSGVIIDPQGHIITNAHVVEGARSLSVIFEDGSKADATLVGADSVSDLAVIQVKGNVPASAPLGDSNALQLGETVIAIGSPLGNYRGSVTVGVVSGLNRSVTGTGQDGLIQTDAAINHGNSGGPLVNLAGQIIGINTLVVRDTTNGDIAEGLGFAIPSATVRAVVEQLIGSGKIDYPFIGVRYSEITPQLASQYNLSSKDGILVSDVTPGSPAAQAGVQQNDIIVALDNNTIDADHSLRSILFKYHVGDTVTLKIQRGNQTLDIKITLVARPAQSQ
jgi:2-alkenal reductase